MPVHRITVTLEQPEYSGLLELAIHDLRDPADQLRQILRDELIRQGLWPAEKQAKVRDQGEGARGRRVANVAG